MYLISFLSQFKYARTWRAFQTYYIVITEKARTHNKDWRIYVLCMGLKPWKKDRFKIDLIWRFFKAKYATIWQSVETIETHIKDIIDSYCHSRIRAIAYKIQVFHASTEKKVAWLFQENRWIDPSSAQGNSFDATHLNL